VTLLTGTLHEDKCAFFIISRSLLLRMGNVSDKSCRYNQETHFMFSNFFSSENRAVYKILWRSITDPGRRQATGDNIIRRLRRACWLPKATETHSEYVILIASPLREWLHERAVMLRHCLCCLAFSSLLILAFVPFSFTVWFHFGITFVVK
jgi:hypothetical protein